MNLPDILSEKKGRSLTASILSHSLNNPAAWTSDGIVVSTCCICTLSRVEHLRAETKLHVRSSRQMALDGDLAKSVPSCSARQATLTRPTGASRRR